MSELLQKFRAKYPQYDDLSDSDLAKKLGTKYPVYLQDAQFKSEFEQATKTAQKSQIATVQGQPVSPASRPKDLPVAGLAGQLYEAATETLPGVDWILDRVPSAAVGRLAGPAFGGMVPLAGVAGAVDPHATGETIKSGVRTLLNPLNIAFVATGNLEGLAVKSGLSLNALRASQRVIGGIAAALTAPQLPAEVFRLKESWQAKNYLQAAEDAANLGMTALTALGGAAMAVGKGIVPKESAGDLIDSAKQSAPQLKQAASEAAKIPPELPSTPKEANASQVQSPTAIHGDVRPQPVSSSGAVPEQVSGSGLRPDKPKRAAGAQPKKKPVEQIQFAAYVDEAGDVFSGANHPSILKRLGVPGFETPESRNTPQFGFMTTSRRFVSREEAAKIAEASGQNLKPFESGEPAHANEIAAPDSQTPISETGKPVIGPPPLPPPLPEAQPGSTAPGMYGVRAKTLERRAKAGEIAPIQPGQVMEPEQIVQRGRTLLEQGSDPNAALAELQRTGTATTDQMAVMRAHGEKLAQAADVAADQFGVNSEQYRAAQKLDSDWQTAIKPMATQAGEAMRALQGETDLDAGTFHGLVRGFRAMHDQDLTPVQEQDARKIAQTVTAADAATSEGWNRVRAHVDQKVSTSKPVVPENQSEAVQSFLSAPGDKKPDYLWAYAKKFYLDRGVLNHDDIFNGIAGDLGLTVKQVRTMMAKQSGTKRLLDDAYSRQYEARQLRIGARRWLQEQGLPGPARLAKNVPRFLFNLAVFGHGTTWIGTHAAQNLFIPERLPAVGRAYGLMWRAVLSKAAYEREVQDMLRDPDFTRAIRAKLNVDPRLRQGDYDAPELLKWSRELSVGHRGALGLMKLRLDLFKQAMAKTPSQFDTPEIRASIASDINHATGTTSMKPVENPWTQMFLFAPRLVAGRFNWLLIDPAKALLTKTFGISAKGVSGWKAATDAEKMLATKLLWNRAKFAGTYLAALGANGAVLQAIGSQETINWDNPHRADWLAFRGFGMELRPFSAGLSIIRLLAQESSDLFHTARKGPHLPVEPFPSAAKDAMQYVRQEFSPFWGDAVSLITQTDTFGRPLPEIPLRTNLGNPPPPVPAYLKRQGIGAYTWGEFAAERAVPIPGEQIVQEAFQASGMNRNTAEHWTKTIIGSAVQGLTGVLLKEEPPQK